jgi:hypothetical protein
MEGDLKEWGDMKEMDVKGLRALGYPSGQAETLSGAGKPPTPDYYPKHQIQALNGAIENLETKYKNILILKYACKLDDRAINKEGLCHYNTVPKWIDEAKHLLVKSRYWKLEYCD